MIMNECPKRRNVGWCVAFWPAWSETGAAARVWAFAEDERRLSRENVLDRQVISLDGEEVLVDVARLGMVAMYWRAPDGRVGQSRRSESGWTQQRLESAQAEQVEVLFDSLANGIRSGVFELPGLLAEVEK